MLLTNFNMVKKVKMGLSFWGGLGDQYSFSMQVQNKNVVVHQNLMYIGLLEFSSL